MSADTFELLKGYVQVVDVGLVMFFVVGLQQFATNDRLQGRVAVLELGETHSFWGFGEAGSKATHQS